MSKHVIATPRDSLENSEGVHFVNLPCYLTTAACDEWERLKTDASPQSVHLYQPPGRSGQCHDRIEFSDVLTWLLLSIRAKLGFYQPTALRLRNSPNFDPRYHQSFPL
jgi:hypothetical protein